MQSTIKYLVEDNGEVKKFNGTSWVSVGSMPATESMFLTDGMTDLSVIDNAAIQALVSDTPKLLM
ncbi:MAG TPA: hypothetical protein VEY51_14715, partial [Chondromyces sp.]|nr:hypothetical protein [Chondromyces sp.]